MDNAAVRYLREWGMAFVPFTEISKSKKLIIKGMWLFIFITFWNYYPGLIVIPTPLEIIRAWWDVWLNDALLLEVWVSAQLFLIATGFTLAISLTLAYLSTTHAFRPVVSVLSKFRYFSLYGLTTIFTMMSFGAMSFKVDLLVFGMASYFITSMAEVVASVPQAELDDARTLRMNEWEVLYHVIIRGRLHCAIEILRQNSAMGWMMLSMVEGMSMSQGGVGTLLVKQYRMLNLKNIYAVQLSIFFIGVLSDIGFRELKLLVCPHTKFTEGSKS